SRNRRPGREGRPRYSEISRRRSRWHSVAGLDLWRMQVLPFRPRKSLRSRAVHRLQHRRRLRGICRGRCAFLFSSTRSVRERLGAKWTGGSDEAPPEELDAAIIFAPVGALMALALRHLDKGGVVVSAGIHMSDIPAFPYRDLWGERAICSVANLTRRDGEEFLEIAPRVPIKTETETFPLAQANEALTRLREGKLNGAAVLLMET